jgi:transcriptional regulator with XRE-family HTH domain
MNESRIGELRKARGWTQERLASRSGVAVRTVQRLEAGKDAGLETLSLIGNTLGVPVRDLFISVEDEDFQTTVAVFDARKSAQQTKRDAAMQGFTFLYRGIGVLLTFATITLMLTGVLSWLGWLIIPAYWAGGGYLFSFLVRAVFDPRLDAKYPLSVPSHPHTGSEPEGF